MKTIEERADEYVGHPFKIGEDTCDTFRRFAYTVGAAEQKRIDIDKACEWLKACNVLTDASLEGFRQAMEE